MKKKIFIFLGAPASGKGTRIKNCEKNGYVSISTSSLLRNAGVNVESGKLASDDLVISLIKKELNKYNQTVILDGFPRTEKQALVLLQEKEVSIEKVFRLKAKLETVLARAEDRLVCPKCQATYTKGPFKRPKEEGICDFCHSILVKRKDDSPEIIKERYRNYLENEKLILKVLKDGGIPVINIDVDSELQQI